jgi:hypothetical protein
MKVTREKVLENVGRPDVLEDLYRSNRKAFAEIIRAVHDGESDTAIKFWHTRLFYKPSSPKGDAKKYIFTAALIVLSWLSIRLGSFFGFHAWEIFPHNVLSLVMFSVTFPLFFAYGQLGPRKILLITIPGVVLGAYLFFLIPLPSLNFDSQSANNAFYFSFVLAWFLVLLSKSDYNLRKLDSKNIIEKTGEVMIWTTIFNIGTLIVFGLTLGLFFLIGLDAWTFIFRDIMPIAFVAAPFVSLLVVDGNTKAKLSVVTANVFLPLILASLVAFGIASIFSETKPFEDRNVFIVYNVMTVIVICVLTFTSINGIRNRFLGVCSYALPIVTIILNSVTLSAVVFRLAEFGVTPNKVTLLGINMVMLGHLAFMVYLKFRGRIERNIAYLPVYFFWSCVVVFVLPFVFRFT